MFEVNEWVLEIQKFIQKTCDFFPKNINCFISALTHKSFFQHNKKSNINKDYEALEFLGDSLINCEIAKLLFPLNKTPGEMSQIRQEIVQSDSIVLTAKKIQLDKLIKTGPSIKEIPDSLIEDCFEAFVAAIFLSDGRKKMKEFIHQTLWTNYLNHEFDCFKDVKTMLQEMVQKIYKKPVVYSHKTISGFFNKKYEINCCVNEEINVTVTDNQIKSGEKKCAQMMIEKLKAKL